MKVFFESHPAGFKIASIDPKMPIKEDTNTKVAAKLPPIRNAKSIVFGCARKPRSVSAASLKGKLSMPCSYKT